MTDTFPRRLIRCVAAPAVIAGLVWGTAVGLAGPAAAEAKAAKPMSPSLIPTKTLEPAAPLAVGGQPVAALPTASMAQLFPDA